MDKQQFFEYLNQSQGFVSQELADAFQSVDRADFVPEEFRDQAYGDFPQPLALGSTISQPSTVLFMINLLDPKPGEKILDVGAGSGWTTAILAKAVGEQGNIVGTEIIAELVESGNANIKKYGISNAQIIYTEKLGLPLYMPYDRILVSAAAQELPLELIDQLKIGGRMIIPIGSSVWQIDKISEDKLETKEYPGFAFVPLKS